MRLRRNFEQMMRSKETDSFAKQWHGCSGTTLGGTTTLNVPVNSGEDQIFVTDISFESGKANSAVALFNGTTYIYHMKLNSVGNFEQIFDTPLKTSMGTALNIDFSSLSGTASINVGGYTVK